jgi:hypothetical protein
MDVVWENRETSDWAGILNFHIHASDPRGRFLLADCFLTQTVLVAVAIPRHDPQYVRSRSAERAYLIQLCGHVGMNHERSG